VTVPPSLPNPPAKPAGAISCVGHRQSYCVPIFSKDDPTWYAYWSETSDSTHAALRIGITSVDTNSIYLIYAKLKWGDTTLQQWWQYNGVDSTVSDSTVAWEYVTNSKDSIIIGNHGVDCGTFYYLKKL
ncbi:MAG: hypothetical protein ACHQM6_07195, partial [Candidatus Kapaibacterium sp.]